MKWHDLIQRWWFAFYVQDPRTSLRGAGNDKRLSTDTYVRLALQFLAGGDPSVTLAVWA